MKRLLRILLKTLGVVVVLLISAWITLLVVVDDEMVVEQMQQAASVQLGANLTVEGQVSVGLFPWLAVSARDVRIEDPLDERQPPFASLGQLELRARTMALLGGTFELQEVVLDGLAIRLRTTPEGHDNWSGFELAEGGDFDFDTLSLAGIRIDDGALYLDGSDIATARFDLSLKPITTQEPSKLRASFSFPETDLTATADASMTVIPPAAFELASAVLEIGGVGDGVRLSLADPLTPKSQQIGFLASSAGIRGEGQLATGETLSGSISLSLTQFDVQTWLSDLEVDWPMRPETLGGWSGTVSARYENQTTTIEGDLNWNRETNIAISAVHRPDERLCVDARIDSINVDDWLLDDTGSAENHSVLDFTNQLKALPLSGEVTIDLILSGEAAAEGIVLSLDHQPESTETKPATASCVTFQGTTTRMMSSEPGQM